MSANTQFMIVTHSKRTMEVARTLYGVTMEDPGVSKLISVKLTWDHRVNQRNSLDGFGGCNFKGLTDRMPVNIFAPLYWEVV